MQVSIGTGHVDYRGSAADASWASCARVGIRPGFLSFLDAQRLLHGYRPLHIVHRLIHIGEKAGLTCRVIRSRPGQLRAPELELLICAVSSVTWLKIARRSFMSSLIFLFACITVVWSRPPNSSPIRISGISVSSRHRYIAIWRAETSRRERPVPTISSTDRPK